MTSTLLRVSLRASRGSSVFAATRLLSTVAAPNVLVRSSSSPSPTAPSPPPTTTSKPSLVLGGASSPPRRVNGCFHAHSQPPCSHNNQEDERKQSDLVVVLDMDECLIHSQFFSPHAAKLAHQLPHNHASSWNYSTSAAANGSARGRNRVVDTFRFTLPDGDVVHVHKRPFLETFLQHVSARFETHVFTAAMEVYASPVLNHLDLTGTVFGDRRWYRDHCLYQDGAYVKDLTPLNTPPHRTVLVDNNPLSFLANPENGILVNNFYNDPSDTTLHAVLDLLDELDDVDDVRPLLNERFGLKQALQHVGGKKNNETNHNSNDTYEQQQQMVACSVE